MLKARTQLILLWVSQTARSLADSCFCILIVLHLARAGGKEFGHAWQPIVLLMTLACILLAPLSGAINNSLPKRWILAGSTAFSLCAAALFGPLAGWTGGPWLWSLAVGVVAANAAVYYAARDALLPVLAEGSRLQLPRVNGWIEMGCVAGLVIGLILGAQADQLSQPGMGAVFEGAGIPSPPAEQLQQQGFSVQRTAVMGLYLLAMLTALAVRFSRDTDRPEPLARSLIGFFKDSQHVLKERKTRAYLVGLTGFWVEIVSGAGLVLAYQGNLKASLEGGILSQLLSWVGGGLVVGALVASVQGHPCRSLGLVPLAATVLPVALVCSVTSSDVRWPCLTLGVAGGLGLVPLRAGYQATVPSDTRGNAMVLASTVQCFLLAAVVVLLQMAHFRLLTPAGLMYLLAGCATAGALLSWWAHLRESLELFLEILLWPFYRVYSHGPGFARIPQCGPLLVIANHSTYLDALWLGKVLPRRLTPVMTSDFYDLPVLHWLMAHVAHTIRMQVSTFRREVPELQEVVARLDQGECVLVFPEGRMRRTSEQALRRFGQGLWHVLRQRPNTPVVACWIEGGWGSFFSYWGGPPGVHKPLDWWRRIDIAVNEPQVLSGSSLIDHRVTRTKLQHMCIEARRHVGLPPLEGTIPDSALLGPEFAVQVPASATTRLAKESGLKGQ